MEYGVTLIVRRFCFCVSWGLPGENTRAVRSYQLATEAIEAAGADPDALEKAMDRFEKASTTMDRVGGWDAETYAQQVTAL